MAGSGVLDRMVIFYEFSAAVKASEPVCRLFSATLGTYNAAIGNCDIEGFFRFCCSWAHGLCISGHGTGWNRGHASGRVLRRGGDIQLLQGLSDVSKRGFVICGIGSHHLTTQKYKKYGGDFVNIISVAVDSLVVLANLALIITLIWRWKR